jgi:hypothetical protein
VDSFVLRRLRGLFCAAKAVGLLFDSCIRSLNMTVFLNLSVLALAFAGSCAAVEKRDLKSLHSNYDYIVVGGGVSGLVVANRLTEDANSAFVYQVHERFGCLFTALT